MLLLQGPGSADAGCDQLTMGMGRVGPRVTSMGNQSGLNEVLELLLLPTDIVSFRAGVSVTAYYFIPGDESVTHDTECLSPGLTSHSLFQILLLQFSF